MTDLEIQAYYASLLILQYVGKEKAEATIKALVKNVIANKVALDVQDAFDLETAVGVQLDVLGLYVGITRKSFAFNANILLDDENFRTVIKMKILINNSGSSFNDIQNLLQIYFKDVIYVFDYLGMRMGYVLNANFIGNDLAEFFVAEGLLPKPMGVQLSATIIIPDPTNMFGYTDYTQAIPNNTPYNLYENYNLTWHWLDYSDAVIV